MGEALLIKTGGAGSGSSSGRNGLITEIFTSNTLWKVPEGIRNNQVSVRIFGGGGGCSEDQAGCGGFMNNGIVNISNDSEIYITIGDGGREILSNLTKSGGVTSFGTYLFASGGTASYGGSGGGSGDNRCSGGIGIQFGGGGYGGLNSKWYPGSGGKWGGGGGSKFSNIGEYNYGLGGCLYENSQNIYEITGFSRLGGNGGNDTINAENGTNTIGMGLDFEGAGLGGGKYSGGGGYGGNGGYNCGGGGGYGANGGNGILEPLRSVTSTGGGGGYGGDGGDGGGNCSAGGGGGYGKHGKGGGWDYKSNQPRLAGIGAGAGTFLRYAFEGNISFAYGGSGICILQYYID